MTSWSHTNTTMLKCDTRQEIQYNNLHLILSHIVFYRLPKSTYWPGNNSLGNVYEFVSNISKSFLK